MKTLVIGASHNPARYSYSAVKLLQHYGHEVVALGRRAREVGDWEILSGTPEIKDLDTITVYMNAQNQQDYQDYILGLHPKRVIFNPGAENPELANKLIKNGVEVLDACTLVMLRTNQY